MDGAWALTLADGSALSFPGPGVFERPVFIAAGADSLHLLRSQGGLVREQLSLPLADQGFPGHLIVVSGVSPRERRALADLLLPREPIRVVEVPPSRWPASFLAWGLVSAVVVADPGPVLSPAQAAALGAWLASGGHLVVSQRLSPSLVDQLSPDTGFGSLGADPAGLKLEPYGTADHPGTSFEPAAEEGQVTPGPQSMGAGILVALWVLGSWLLSRTKKVKAGTLMAAALAASVLVAAGSALGLAPWNRGLTIHTRQVVLPGGVGAVTSVQVVRSKAHSLVVAWPEASPWSLDQWKAERLQGTLHVRESGADRVVAETFGPAAPRTSSLTLSGGSAPVWTREGRVLEAAPDSWQADAGWALAVARSTPGWVWSLGHTVEAGQSVAWMAPRPREARP
jgi:hypothetical protein